MINLTLYFENSQGKRREIGKPKTEKEVFKIIHQFLDEHNFKSYYTRTWLNPDNELEKIYDVGSHSEFFICYNSKGWLKNEY